jgi:hypothetical protein
MSSKKRARAQVRNKNFFLREPADEVTVARCRIMPALNRIYRSRHRRGVLPDNEEGKKAIEYLAMTMRTARYSVGTRLERLKEHAPWLNDSQIERLLSWGCGIVTNATGKRRPLPDIISGSYLGQALEVDNDEREMLKAWWIKPCDMSDEEFEAYKCEKKRQGDRGRRRKKGAKPREDSDSRTKPWIAAGFKCRRTWQRHGKPDVLVQNSRVLGINSLSKIARLNLLFIITRILDTLSTRDKAKGMNLP